MRASSARRRWSWPRAATRRRAERPATAPAEDGTTSCDILITDDASEVSLEVRDPQGAAGSDIIPITVIPTESPEASILTPEEDGVYYSDQLITFTGILWDGEDDADVVRALTACGQPRCRQRRVGRRRRQRVSMRAKAQLWVSEVGGVSKAAGDELDACCSAQPP